MLPKAFQIPDFPVLFSGRVLSTLALQCQAVVVGWHIYELTHDPLYLGLIGLAEAAPAIGFAFVSGHVVDNRRPAAIYRWCLTILFLNAILLWFSALAWLPISADVRLLTMFLAVFVSGVVRSFMTPSTFSLVSHIVPRTQIAEAAAWNSSSYQLAAIVGPPLGGLIYGAYGATVAFAIPPLFLLAAFVSTRFFSTKTISMRANSTREAFLTSVKSGIQFAWQQKILLSSLTLDMFSVLFGGAVAVLPMFSDQILNAGSTGLGILRAAPSVGSALMLLVLVVWPLHTISGRWFLGVVAGFGACTVAFAVTRSFPLAFFFLAASGAFDGVSMVIRNTILQLYTPENMRGRVSSLSLIFITSSNEIGAFESGLAARLLGLVPSIVFGGCMTLGIVGFTTWAAPDLRKMKLRPAD